MLNSRNEGLENVSYEKWKYPVDPTRDVVQAGLVVADDALHGALPRRRRRAVGVQVDI